MWPSFRTVIVIGWCLCSQCKSSIKSSLIQKIKGSLSCSMIFAFRVKILIPNQQFEKHFWHTNRLSCSNHAPVNFTRIYFGLAFLFIFCYISKTGYIFYNLIITSFEVRILHVGAHYSWHNLFCVLSAHLLAAEQHTLFSSCINVLIMLNLNSYTDISFIQSMSALLLLKDTAVNFVTLLELNTEI